MPEVIINEVPEVEFWRHRAHRQLWRLPVRTVADGPPWTYVELHSRYRRGSDTYVSTLRRMRRRNNAPSFCPARGEARVPIRQAPVDGYFSRYDFVRFVERSTTDLRQKYRDGDEAVVGMIGAPPESTDPHTLAQARDFLGGQAQRRVAPRTTIAQGGDGNINVVHNGRTIMTWVDGTDWVILYPTDNPTEAIVDRFNRFTSELVTFRLDGRTIYGSTRSRDLLRRASDRTIMDGTRLSATCPAGFYSTQLFEGVRPRSEFRTLTAEPF